MADPRSKELNMLDGPILPRILQFTLPLAATGMLQLLFNAADVIVVGKFSGSIALAAVGATSTLVNLIVNTFIGISVGVNILVARRIGCHDADGVSRASHCAVALSALLGLLVMAIGLLFSRPMLEWMETPADILEKSTLYLKLYFLGVPFTLIYNFGAAILRAYGDTRRPADLSDGLRRGQRAAESVLRHRLQDRRRRRRHRDGHLTGHLGVPCHALPAAV